MTGAVRYGPDLRVLVVGGGIAGLTCAGLLEQRGFSPDVVEKTDSYGGLGYALGLWPAGSNILKGLGTYETFASHADPMHTYTLLSDSGEQLHSYDLRPLTDEYGEARLIWRPRLIDVLRETVSDETMRMGTTVTDIHQHDDVVDVSFSDGTEDTYDHIDANSTAIADGEVRVVASFDDDGLYVTLSETGTVLNTNIGSTSE